MQHKEKNAYCAETRLTFPDKWKDGCLMDYAARIHGVRNRQLQHIG
jgi:hypothetical protein